jgi:hypothetical protein
MIIPFDRISSVFLNPKFNKAENILKLTALGLRKKVNFVSAFKSMPTTFQDSFKHDMKNSLSSQQSYVLTRHYHQRFTQLSDNISGFLWSSLVYFVAKE